MTIRMDSLIKAIAKSLDSVESELLGASTNHGKRIAVLCARMGKLLGKNADEINALIISALFHDNALTEYILAEHSSGQHDPNMKSHCEFGQRNIDAIGFKTNMSDFILYHHERADGKGPFGIKEGEGSIEAELIAIADSVDVMNHLQRIAEDDLPAIIKFIKEETGKRYSKIASGAMLEILDWPTILTLKDDVIDATMESEFIPWTVEVEAEILFGIAAFVVRIIDYKSAFTRRHSNQIANKAWFMGDYYKYDPAERTALYLAAALHDIGKLEVPLAILEKPDKLTDEEFATVKEHVKMTWELLKDIEGFHDVSVWASNHHEKLDGSGYPFGRNADELDLNSRLMTCIDIYQAVSEDRPYHVGRNHSDTMRILHAMANLGEIDKDIVNDMDSALAPYDGKDLPPPP